MDGTIITIIVGGIVSIATAIFGYLAVRDQSKFRGINDDLQRKDEWLKKLGDENRRQGEEIAALAKKHEQCEEENRKLWDANHRIQVELDRVKVIQLSVQTASADGMIVVDGKGTITQVNPEAVLLSQYGEKELLGQSLLKLIPERYRQDHERKFAATVAAGRQVRRINLPLHLLTRYGRELPVEVSLIGWGQGDAAVYVGVMRERRET